MKEYTREYPLFSLCGLNCGLCPRYHTSGESKCPGCGGPSFHEHHPSCSVINCNAKHDNVEYCFQCSSYPCERYNGPNTKDSFITYRNVSADSNKAARDGLERYAADLNEKVSILEYLLSEFNDGRRKSFYCTAVNLIELDDLRDLMNEIKVNIEPLDCNQKEKIDVVVKYIESVAEENHIDLKLRQRLAR